MHITGAKYCDFVLCSSKMFYVERIYYDPEFVKSAIEKVSEFYFRYVLPELTLPSTDKLHEDIF